MASDSTRCDRVCLPDVRLRYVDRVGFSSVGTTPQIAQIALCRRISARSVQLYTEGFGFAEAGGKVLWGPRVAQIQALGDDSAFTLWWLVGRQDLVQLEFFHHTTPPQRAVADRAPNDLGWSRFGIAVPDFDAALERLAGPRRPAVVGAARPRGTATGLPARPLHGTLVEVLEEGAATPGGIRPRFYDLVPAVVYATINVPDLAEARRCS